MAYFDVATLSGDGDFIGRCTAGYATEPSTADPNTAPQWADAHRWQLAGAPGFGDAYASAIESGVPNPGRDPSVISDAQILSAIQAITAS